MNKFIKQAFTLIELLVVIAIIGILSGLIVISMKSSVDSANDAKRKANIDVIKKALVIYGTLNGGVYPIITTGCNIGDSGVNGCGSLFNTPMSQLLPSLPIDPVSGYYKYISNGETFSVSATLANNVIYNYYSTDGYTTIDNTSLIANWPMHEGVGTSIIDKGGVNTCTLNGGTPWTNNRLSFNGSIFVDCGTTSTLKPKNFSISLWFNSVDVAPAYRTLIGNGWDGGAGFGLWTAYNAVTFYVGNGVSPRKNEMSSAIVSNTWYNVVAIYSEGVGSKLYVNGILKSSLSTFTGSLVYDANSFNIGKLYGGYYYFNGSIDDVRIYNRILSQVEITAIYNLQKTSH